MTVTQEWKCIGFERNEKGELQLIWGCPKCGATISTLMAVVDQEVSAWSVLSSLVSVPTPQCECPVCKQKTGEQVTMDNAE